MKAWFPGLVFGLCLLPLAWLVAGFFLGWLGANPPESVIQQSGLWTLRLLLLTLAVTPLRRLWPSLIRLRRMLGLFAFFYASLHLLAYLWLDKLFAWPRVWEDILQRPFITIGMAAYLLLIPLALTSTQAMIERLGRHWQSLHRLVYLAALAGVGHFWWLVKADISEPLAYAVILAGLLVWRIADRRGLH